MRAAFLLLLLCSCFASAQLLVDGSLLEAKTSRLHATFRGGDLVRFQNLLTDETAVLAKPAPEQPIARLVGADGSTAESASGYGWALGDYQGLPFAYLVRPDGSPGGIRMEVWIDPSTEQLAVRIAGETPSRGLRGVRWGLSGLDLATHRLILPITGGIVFDGLRPPPAGFTATSETRWEAPFLMLASRQGGMVAFNSRHEAPYRRLEVVSSEDLKVSVAVETTSVGSWAAATAIGPVEWRLDCYRGGWQDGADIYRAASADWTEPRLAMGADWIREIRTVIKYVGQLDLDRIATLTDPKQTLLYLPDWRAAGYDRNYPDYAPAAGLQAYLDRARQLGFRIMLHVNPYGVSTYHPEYERMRRYQVRDPERGQLQGWLWDDRPATDPIRFAYINPASNEWRALFIRSIRPALLQLRPDALHIDQTGLALNDGNGLVDSRTAVDGMIQLHKDLAAEFPAILISGESIYDQLAPFQWLAQRWLAVDNGVPGTPHPLGSYLLGSRFKLYGNLATPAPGTRDYLAHINQHERQAVTPTIDLTGQLDNISSDLDRAFRVARVFQQNRLTVTWTQESSEERILYSGASGTSAVFSVRGPVKSFDVGDSTLYQRVTGASTVRSPLVIRDWLAFENQTFFGLDPSREYWLDPGPRPDSSTRFSLLPDSVSLTNASFHAPEVSVLGARPASVKLFDLVDIVGTASTGINDEVDRSLAGVASVQVSSIAVNGSARPSLLVHPPGGPGRTFVDFPIALPQSSSGISLTFAAGIADGSKRTLPVRFAVAVNDQELWQSDILPGAWTPANINLSRFAGSRIRLRFLTQATTPEFAWAGFGSPIIVQTAPAGPIRIRVAAPGKTGVSVLPPAQASNAAQFEIANVPNPGETTLFYEPLRNWSMGQSLVDLRPTILTVPAREMPRAVVTSGVGTVSGALSGGVLIPRAISAHPPEDGETHLIWAGRMPNADAQLSVAAGMYDGNQSTGILFRIQVNGETVWESRSRTAGWQRVGVDLRRYRNQPVMIRLITGPEGPNSFDWAFWGDLTLTVR